MIGYALHKDKHMHFIVLFIFVNISKCFISSGLELNPALREGSISHPFHFLRGFQVTKRKDSSKDKSETKREDIRIDKLPHVA